MVEEKYGMENTFQTENEDKDTSSSKHQNVPSWIPHDDDEEEDAHDDFRSSQLCFSQDHLCQSVATLPKLDAMPPDVSASILQSLSVQEIATVSKVNKAMYLASRNPDLWKLKFRSRWNFSTSGDSFDWFLSYIQAYQSTQDLWITHWNCVEPTDSLAPGRCCIRQTSRYKQGNRDSSSFGFQELCPTCRYEHNPTATKLPSTIKTKAQAVGAATALRLQQHSEFLFPEYSSRLARKAFTQSSTLHRNISTQQYNANSLCLLSDLLFFQVHDGPQELEDLKGIFPVPEHHPPHDGSDTCLHSWHVVHFSNPDFNRPLLWKISIQRQDCFTVYPSEGYLKPGATQSVIFGVKPLASLFAHATHQLNAHREGVDEFWANVYTEEAHLPVAPFQIHYQHALVIPCRHPEDDSHHRYHQRSQHMQIHQTQIQEVENRATTNLNLISPWQHSSHVHQPLRTMHLSAHVNANYSLSEFRRSTLVPFDIRSYDQRSSTYCAPQLMVLHPSVWTQLENIDLELEDSIRAQAYRTESPCRICGISWGERLEELGQAYVVAKIECGLDKQKRDQIFQRIHLLLMTFLQHAEEDIPFERYLSVCYAIHKTLTAYRGAPWLSQRQQLVLLQWEALIDHMCQIRNEEVDTKDETVALRPWRHAGMYNNALCSDSVFSSKDVQPTTPDGDILWKEEPQYLEAFAHLAHNAGRFCLGPQEDPNHLRPQGHDRFRRRQKGVVSDMFMDDPICGLQSALCVLYDPRSLLVHGIYDRVLYPGTIVRRPKLPCLPALAVGCCPFEIKLESFIASPRTLAYYEIQNSLDLESLSFVDSMCGRQVEKKPLFYPLSLLSYLQNIPPPGAGRFPFSTGIATDAAESVSHIQELRVDVEEFSDTSSVGSTRDRGRVEDQEQNDMNNILGGRANNDAAAPRPRIVRYLWAMATYMGLTIEDNRGATSVYVDRRILIGAHWLSISLMTAPLFWTLIARLAMWVPTTPVDYKLEALPYIVETEMRFLTEKECGYASLVLVCLWLFLGRWIERYTSRDFLRAMLEDVSFDDRANLSFFQRLCQRSFQWCQRTWDAVCPLFLQRMVFVPQWNRRSSSDLMNHVAFWRSQNHREHRSAFLAAAGRGSLLVESGNQSIDLGEESNGRKLLIGMLVATGSFSVSSPHFSLNLLTVFLCSISFGLSMSLESMEVSRADVTFRTTGSLIRPLSMVTIVILSCLVGQLVGCSGGFLFVVEFMFESMFLVLGGAGTLSPGATESWFTFFCLSLTAFWGYLFGRVAVLDGIRQKKRVVSSIMLCLCIVATACLWLLAVFGWNWDFPVSLVILRPTVDKDLRNGGSQFTSRQLQ